MLRPASAVGSVAREVLQLHDVLEVRMMGWSKSRGVLRSKMFASQTGKADMVADESGSGSPLSSSWVSSMRNGMSRPSICVRSLSGISPNSFLTLVSLLALSIHSLTSLPALAVLEFISSSRLVVASTAFDFSCRD